MSRLTEAEREEWSAEAEVENTFSGVIAAPRKIFFGVLSWLMFWRSPTLKQKPDWRIVQRMTKMLAVPGLLDVDGIDAESGTTDAIKAMTKSAADMLISKRARPQVVKVLIHLGVRLDGFIPKGDLLHILGSETFELRMLLDAIEALPDQTGEKYPIPSSMDDPVVLELIEFIKNREASQTQMSQSTSQSFGPEAQYPPGETPYSSAPSQESVPSQSQQPDTPASQGKKRPVPKTPPKAKAKDTGGKSPRRKKAKKAVEAEEAAEAEAADDDSPPPPAPAAAAAPPVHHTALMKFMDDADKKIKELESTVQAKDVLIADRDKVIAELRKKLAAKEAADRELRKKLAAKEAADRALSEDITTKYPWASK